VELLEHFRRLKERLYIWNIIGTLFFGGSASEDSTDQSVNPKPVNFKYSKLDSENNILSNDKALIYKDTIYTYVIYPSNVDSKGLIKFIVL
jgi:hypothetical protein